MIELWNGPGQEKFRSLGKIFIKDSDIMIFVYDITMRESFNDLKDYHIPTAYKILGNNFKGVIVANKSDLSDLFPNKIVSEEEGKQLANSYGFKFTLTSAKCNAIDFRKFVNEIIVEKLNEKNWINKKELEDFKKEIENERKKGLETKRKKELENLENKKKRKMKGNI